MDIRKRERWRGDQREMNIRGKREGMDTKREEEEVDTGVEEEKWKDKKEIS